MHTYIIYRIICLFFHNIHVKIAASKKERKTNDLIQFKFKNANFHYGGILQNN